jgi:hypothetical protein
MTMDLVGEPGHVRRAGSGCLPGGRRLTWTVADGRRGRRWRAITTSGDRLLHGLLLEVAPDGGLQKLEVASPGGLLTLHPDPDRSVLHGNVVRAAGIEHLALPWSRAHVLMLGASPVTAAVAAGNIAARLGVGEGVSVPAVEVSDALRIRPATWRAARTAERRWRLLAADAGPSVVLEIDDDGVPAGLEDADSWPLELATDQ